jgi:hypothetical protein
VDVPVPSNLVAFPELAEQAIHRRTKRSTKKKGRCR